MLCHVSLHVFIGHWFIFLGEISLQTVLHFILVAFSLLFCGVVRVLCFGY